MGFSKKKKTKLTTSSRKSRTSGTGNRFRIVQGVPEGSPVILQKMAESSTGAVPKGGGGGGAASGYHGPPQQQGAQHRGPPPLRNVVDINQFSHIDPERWICIYPAYLNSRKSRAEGRLVPRDKGIADPNWMECQHVLAPKGFRFLVEPGKGYPKERSREPHFRGRVRLQLKGEDGQPLNPEFKTRYECQLILCLLLRVKTVQ